MKFAKPRPATAKEATPRSITPRRVGASCEIKPLSKRKDIEPNERLSFQNFIGGMQPNPGSPENELLSSEVTAKVNRLRNSMAHLRHSAQSDQIRTAIESAMNEALKDFVVDGTPEERLQAIMTTAKESGLTLDKLFSYFQGENNCEGYMTKQGFLDALCKLGDNLFMVTDEEMLETVKKFDVNGDGMISLSEFKAYCLYQIPGVTWKAERQRLELSGDVLQITADLKAGFERGEVKIYPCGDEVYRASKLFWQTNISVEMELFYCAPMDVITLRLFNLSDGEMLPILYVKKSECKIDKKIAEDPFVTTLDVSGTHHMEGDRLTQIKEEWSLVGKYILARLKLKISPRAKIPKEISSEASSWAQPYLSKLAGDTFQTLTISRPINIGNPPAIESHSKASLADMQHALTSFSQMSMDLRASRDSAQVLAKSVEDALRDIRNEFG